MYITVKESSSLEVARHDLGAARYRLAEAHRLGPWGEVKGDGLGPVPAEDPLSTSVRERLRDMSHLPWCDPVVVSAPWMSRHRGRLGIGAHGHSVHRTCAPSPTSGLTQLRWSRGRTRRRAGIGSDDRAPGRLHPRRAAGAWHALPVVRRAHRAVAPGLIAVSVYLPRRPARAMVVVAVGVSLVIWVFGENFGTLWEGA